MTDLLAVTYGPLPVLADLLAAQSGVDAAFIYGSWAARYRGEPGPLPADVDVLVAGTADRDDLDDIARAAQDRLFRPGTQGIDRRTGKPGTKAPAPEGVTSLPPKRSEPEDYRIHQADFPRQSRDRRPP
ncbi:MAG TPA: hypothetical protein VFQ44_28630 [Streptosporangiaceae bacterium]|nr:hypothetical protein [Streptosporangiaceae bacterium]